MEISKMEEIWQIDAGGQVYEASFEEMTAWIGEGALLPQDKVKRGSLRWIEAGKVPSLVAFFNAKEQGIAPPVSISATDAEASEQNFQARTENFAPEQNFISSISEAAPVLGETSPQFSNFSESKNNFDQQNFAAGTDFCCVHAEEKATYLCDTCANAFCSECPTSFGGNVKICPFCGAMCRSIKEFKAAHQANLQLSNAVSEGFGFADFSRALSHPFKYKSSLIIGAVLFMFFTIGQSAAAVGGIFMIVAAIFCMMGANMLTFGILANTVENFSQGKLETNFMPNFDDFSLWDDVIHPFFLSLAAYISSFGAFILVLIIGVYFVVSAMTAQTKVFQEEFSKTPGTLVFDTQKTMEQSEQVKQLTENLRRQNAKRLEQQTEIAAGAQDFPINDEEAEFAELNEMIQQSRKQQLESVVGKSPETERQEFAQMVQGFLSLAAPLVVIGFLTFLWGVFYLPAACAVAGYTRSFTATINPLVGLDTIKRLGFDYVKILLMGISIVIISGVLGLIIGALLSPFDMPRMGNIPANAVGSFITFYFSIVFSCILGFALYKNSSKLKLFR
jgi:hypothetical protein